MDQACFAWENASISDNGELFLMAEWTKDQKGEIPFQPELVAQKIDQTMTLSPKGEIVFKNIRHLDFLMVLESMVTFEQEVPELEKQNIISRATSKAASTGKITATSLLKEINGLERQYLSINKREFRLLTDISISNSWNKLRFSYKGSNILIGTDLKPAFWNSRSELLKQARYSIFNDLPENYASATVTVFARSAPEAADMAIDRLDFIRAIWNLVNIIGRYRMSSGKREPVNPVLLGPIHTLHNPDGSLATRVWWYEPEYQGPVKVYDESTKREKLFKSMNYLRGLMKRSKYATDMENVLLRYVRALDHRDWNNSFLELWSILEFLTGKPDRYNVMIRRASCIFKDKAYIEQLLLHLRLFRNKYVHAAAGSNQIEAYIYQLKSCVDQIILWHLTKRFASLQDAVEYMDILKSDEIQIKDRIKKLRLALKNKRPKP
jgi:hypothetical protein